MDKIKVRKADIIASLLLIAFGIFVVVESTKMPMEASYGGVESHWYVAPALFPLFVGVMLIILGVALMGIAIKDGGLKALIRGKSEKNGIVLGAKTIRTLTVALAIGSFIYVFVPRVDFFIGIATFLFFLTTVFYPESDLLRRRLTYIFGIETAFFALAAITGFWALIDGYYIFDALAIFTYVAMVIVSYQTAKKDGVDPKKIRTTLLLSLIVPAFLCPVFRFPLRTPLPKEGVILDVMIMIVSRIRYGA